MSASKTILLIDDEIGDVETQHHRTFARTHAALPFQFHFCPARGGTEYTVCSALRAIDAMAAVRLPDLVLLDLQFGPRGQRLGLEILREINAYHPTVPVLILSSLDRDVTTLGLCLEDGAVGFVPKAASPKVLRESVERAIAIAGSHVLLGNSPAMRELRRQAARLSPYDQIPVLIRGERGTGKERVARHIHHNGTRCHGLLVAVNCAAIPETLIESELFGSDKGSFTGAVSQRIGLIERAHGGVLFLDEIGDLPRSVQAKLLRVLQDGTFRRVGDSNEELISDFHLICATNADLEKQLDEGTMRHDFHERIAAVTVQTPPLRACTGDIPELANHFLRQLGLEGKKVLDAEVLDVLSNFTWPGNVRQLQRVIQEAVVRSEDSVSITRQHLPEFVRQGERQQPANRESHPSAHGLLPSDPAVWARFRLRHELELILAAKEHIQSYKGQQWKAEFMRLMYPHCKAANAKGFSDLVKRLSQGPWGDPEWSKDSELKRLIDSLDN